MFGEVIRYERVYTFDKCNWRILDFFFWKNLNPEICDILFEKKRIQTKKI